MTGEELKGVTVIIPALNEEGTIAEVARGAREGFESTGRACEVIVVDDGSTDRTPEMAASAGGKVFRHPHNLGYGRSIVSGVDQAQYDLIALIDADGTYEVSALPQLVDFLDQYDMAVGVRMGLREHEGSIKRFARWWLNFLASYVTGDAIPDVNSGMRAFRRTVLEGTRHIICYGFSYTTTLTLSVHSRRLFVRYEEVPYRGRGSASNVRSVRDTFRALQIILQTIVYYNPVKAVLPFCALAVLAAFLYFLAFLASPSALLALGSGLSFLFALLFILIGMIMDAIRMNR